jgi:hypothetical protein
MTTHIVASPKFRNPFVNKPFTSKNFMAVYEMELSWVSQAFQLLRASLTTSSALNDVFAKE